MKLRLLWIPFFILGAVIWVLASLEIKNLVKHDRAYPQTVILGDKACVLRNYESAIFEVKGGGRLYVMRLPKEVKEMPTR